MRKKILYIFLVVFTLVGVVISDVSSVKAENITQEYTIRINPIYVKISGSPSKGSEGGLIGTSSGNVFVDFSSMDISSFDIDKPINVNISYDLQYKKGSSTSLSFISRTHSFPNGNFSEPKITLSYGSTNITAGYEDGVYSYDFIYQDDVSKFLISILSYQWVKNTSSISSIYTVTDNYTFSNISVVLSQELEEETPSDTEIETPPDTEILPDTETPSDTENDGSDSVGDSDNLIFSETAIYNALTAYFKDNPLDVVMVSDGGIDKKLSDLTFEEVCLLSLLLLKLGSSILHIIGGRAWNK